MVVKTFSNKASEIVIFWDPIYPFSSNTVSCELFDCYSIWFGGYLTVPNVGYLFTKVVKNRSISPTF